MSPGGPLRRTPWLLRVVHGPLPAPVLLEVLEVTSGKQETGGGLALFYGQGRCQAQAPEGLESRARDLILPEFPPHSAVPISWDIVGGPGSASTLCLEPGLRGP